MVQRCSSLSESGEDGGSVERHPSGTVGSGGLTEESDHREHREGDPGDEERRRHCPDRSQPPCRWRRFGEIRECNRREYYGYKVAAMTDGQSKGAVSSDLDADHLTFLVLSLAGWWSAVPQVARMIAGAESEAEHARRRASVVMAASHD